MANSDVTMSVAWKKYRQALRDLPSTANPTLDKNEDRAARLIHQNYSKKPSYVFLEDFSFFYPFHLLNHSNSYNFLVIV